MAFVSFETKKAYFAKVRRQNYRNSLRLEGFDVEGWRPKYRTRKEAVTAYKRAQDIKHQES